MADNPTDCEDYFQDCSKTELTWAMFWKKLITKSGTNNCPAIRVKTDISLDVEELNVNMADVEAGIGAPSDAAATTDAGTFSLIALTKRLLEKLTSGITVFLGAGEAHIGEVGGNLISVAVEKTRPGDTNPYITGDVINESTSAGTVWTFSNLARKNDGTGYITKARLHTDQKTNTARYRVHLFHTAPTAINDNVPNTVLYADFSKRIGHFDLQAMSTATDSTNSTAAMTSDLNLRIPFKSVSGGRSVFAVLEALDGFTPANGQKYYLELTADNN